MDAMPKFALFSAATQSEKEVLDQLSSTQNGLLSTQVAKLQALHGRNVLSGHSVTWWQIFLRQVKSPFIYILVAAAALAYFLGEFIDSAFIFVFISINT